MSRLRADLQLDDLVESIIRDLPGRVAAMERAFADQDLETLAVLAHQLKGAGDFYGSREISEAARSAARFTLRAQRVASGKR